jgi:hypothetical protein
MTPEPATRRVAGGAEPITDASTLDGPKGESALVVEHLTKHFGDRVAFDDVSFTVASAIYSGTHVLVQLLFTPLLAGWGIWVGIAVSARSTDVRVAQQLSVLGTLPLLAVLALMSLNVITVPAGLAVGLAAVLLAVDLLAWRVVAAMFDRERLITGRRT